MTPILQRTGYHTCKKTPNLDLKKVPFLSKYEPERKKFNYLGTGYYVWEGNIEIARWWGKQHYNNNYVIIKMTLQIPDNELLDLVGNVEQMQNFWKLYEIYKRKVGKQHKIQSGKFLDLHYFSKINEEKNIKFRVVEFIQWLRKTGIFAFNIIKVRQPSKGDKEMELKGNDKLYLSVKQYYCFYSRRSPTLGIEYFIDKEIVEN